MTLFDPQVFSPANSLRGHPILAWQDSLMRCIFLGGFQNVSCRVSDPHWFNGDPDTDPDPAFFLIADPDSGSGSRTPKLQEKPSALKREHPALQKMKIRSFFLFLGSFLPSWIRIRIRNLYADPDQAAQINADPDPDPKPWFPELMQNTAPSSCLLQWNSCKC